jgi:hypothetical protein
LLTETFLQLTTPFTDPLFHVFWAVHQHAVKIPKWPVIGITGMFVAVFGLTTP